MSDAPLWRDKTRLVCIDCKRTREVHVKDKKSPPQRCAECARAAARQDRREALASLR